eukprot:PhM_4_TR2534/c0_g1_i1/m.61450
MILSLASLTRACPAVFATGLNYHCHAKETGLKPPSSEPIWTMKNPSSITTTTTDVVRVPAFLKDMNELIDYEGELAMVLLDDVCNVSEEQLLHSESYSRNVLAATCAFDITARRFQGKRGGGQWCYSKSFDTFCPLGPVITPWWDVKKNEKEEKIALTTVLSGKQVQHVSDVLSEMVFSPERLVAMLSRDMTLRKGTVILTGTPSGVGYTQTPVRVLQDKDIISVNITNIGELTRRVVFE